MRGTILKKVLSRKAEENAIRPAGLCGTDFSSYARTNRFHFCV